MWELDGWQGLARNFEHEFDHATLQDPSLAEWWAVAASLRRGGVDRIVVPEPWTRSIDELVAEGVRGALYAHELVRVPVGTAPRFLTELHDVGVNAMRELGAENVGAFRVAMVNDSECIVIWAVPDWSTWTAIERAWLGDGPLDKWRAVMLELQADWRRSLLVEAPLSPMRAGRQPQIEDRVPLADL
jgi:hypothetical protein